MRPVTGFSPDGQNICLTDQDRRNLLIDIELLKAWGFSNMVVIKKYNEQIK